MTLQQAFALAEELPERELSDSEREFTNYLRAFEAIDGLRGDGTLDRTLAIFTSDHGEEFWEYGENRGHGKSLTDPAIQVPLLVRFPEDARVAAGTRVARDVELVDIVPTVLDLTATAWTTPGDGRSLLTMPEPENWPIYSSLDFDGTQMEAVRSFPWKLV